MATFRNQPTDSYALGSAPPEIRWTVVRGDSAAFRVYVTNDAREPLLLEDWEVDMDIRRNGVLVVSLSPQPNQSVMQNSSLFLRNQIASVLLLSQARTRRLLPLPKIW